MAKRVFAINCEKIGEEVMTEALKALLAELAGMNEVLRGMAKDLQELVVIHRKTRAEFMQEKAGRQQSFDDFRETLRKQFP